MAKNYTVIHNTGSNIDEILSINGRFDSHVDNTTTAHGIDTIISNLGTLTTNFNGHTANTTTAHGIDTIIQTIPTNLKNGTAIGSLRQTDASEETSSYSLGMDAAAFGKATRASGQCAFAEGKYNISDENDIYAHIVGNGSDDNNRSNAHTLDWQGNAWFAGEVTIGDNRDVLAKKKEIDSLKYYGDLNITPTSADSFLFSTGIVPNTATLFSVKTNVDLGENVVFPYEVIINGSKCTVTEISGGVFSNYNNKNTITKIIIPNTVEVIGDYAFRGCAGLTTLQLSSSLGKNGNFGSYMFAECSNLTDVLIPEGILQIGNHMFRECTKLTSIFLPDSVKYIKQSAFWGCTSLSSIKIGKNLLRIESGAFSECSALSNVYFNGAIEEWQKILIDSGNNPLISAVIYYDYYEKIDASLVSYDNSQSGLNATNVQTAIDKLSTLLPTDIKDFYQVQELVEDGYAKRYFSIGDHLVVNKGLTELPFTIIGIDEDIPISSTWSASTSVDLIDSIDYFTFMKYIGICGGLTLSCNTPSTWMGSNGREYALSEIGFTFKTGYEATDFVTGDTVTINIPHTLTLMLTDTTTTSSTTFDAPECTFYLNPADFESGMAVGTYHFDMDDKTYQFTLTTPVAAGGAIRINTSGAKIATFNDVSQERATELVSYTEGSEGTGISGFSPIEYGRNDRQNGLNQSQYGLNDFLQSSVRQLINSRLGSNWWQAQSPWDRPSNADKVGFLYNLESDFTSVIKPVYKKTKRSQAFASSDIVTSQELVFLPSISEVYGGTTTTGDEGEPYSFFGVGSSTLPSPGSGADSNRIIKSGNTAKSYWLRSRFPSSPNATQVAAVKADGSIGAILAYLDTTAAPCCVIY